MVRVQELEAIVAERTESANTKEATGSDEATAESLKALQTEYDQYKETQEEKYNSGVTRVNAVNVSHRLDHALQLGLTEWDCSFSQRKLTRDSRELKALKAALTDGVLPEPKVQEASSPAELAQKVREALTKAANVPGFEESASQKEAGVQTETAADSDQTAVPAQTQPLSQELEQLKKQLDEANALAETRAQEARAADEKAKKLAVKAQQADKLKALTNDLKAKLAELQATKTAVPMLSVKGGAAAAPGTSANPVDVASSAPGSTSNGDTGSPAGAAANTNAEGVSVRGRGAARGTAMRARGRGAARGGARGINPQAILSRKSRSRE